MVATIVLVVSNKPIQSSMNNTSSDSKVTMRVVWFPDPSVMRMRGRGKKGLGNNYTLARTKAGI